MTINIRI